MKLKYKILCIDDNIKSLKNLKRRLGKVNGDVGIETCYYDITATPNQTETDVEEQAEFKYRMKNELNEALEKSIFDLILIDLHMQDESVEDPLNGPYFVEAVREQTIYRPIVFYSGGYPADSDATKQLQEAIEEAGLWGKSMMVCSRDKLFDFLKDLMEEMHTEEHKINNVRGLLMDQISEIDAMFIEAIKHLWPQILDENQDAVKNIIKERSGNSVKNATKAHKNAQDGEFENLPETFICNYKACDLNSRIIILNTILKQFDDESLELAKKISKLCSSNEKTLIHIRNDYGHRTAEELEEDLNHDKNRCIHIRKEIKKHLKHAEDILSKSKS